MVHAPDFDQEVMLLKILSFNIFWICLFTLFYSYAGYPVLLFLLACLKNKRISKSAWQPTVSLIISVYNEKKVIRERLENAFAQKYPKENLEILVASDGSTDGTHNIVESFKNRGVKLIVQKERLGKTSALNMTVPLANGEIIVFTDANSMYDKDAIRAMIENFADPTVGCVTGETRLVNPEKSAIGENEKSYYDYDTFLKIKESAIGSTVGADGAIFAIRKELYEPLDPSLINDFVIPLQVVGKGYRVVYEPRAFLYEDTATPLKGGFSRRVRIINRSLFGLAAVPQVLNPLRVGFFAVQVISRKVLRWTAPVFIIGVFLANLGLVGFGVYGVFFLLQVIFFLTALLPIIFGREMKNRFLNFPYYFCHGNAAALVALVKFFKGERIVVWDPLRR